MWPLQSLSHNPKFASVLIFHGTCQFAIHLQAETNTHVVPPKCFLELGARIAEGLLLLGSPKLWPGVEQVGQHFLPGHYRV